ncbi:MAG: VOC family protein [Pseudomonadota bacterium]
MSSSPDYADGLTLSMPVADLDASIAWYERVLGFSLIYKMDDLGWCEMKSPVADVNVGLSAVETPNPGGATPTFGVKDVAAEKAKLEAAGVRIDGDIMTIEGMVSLVTFYDPDDNSLMFFQDLS